MTPLPSVASPASSAPSPGSPASAASAWPASASAPASASGASASAGSARSFASGEASDSSGGAGPFTSWSSASPPDGGDAFELIGAPFGLRTMSARPTGPSNALCFWFARQARSRLLLVVDDLGVDDLVVLGLAGTGPGVAGVAAGRGALGRCSLVQLLGEALAGRHQGVGGVADGLDVAAAEGRAQVAELVLDRRLLVTRDLVALLLEQLLGLVDERVGLVADLGLLAARSEE